jgi:hypothetical protein
MQQTHMQEMPGLDVGPTAKLVIKQQNLLSMLHKTH